MSNVKFSPEAESDIVAVYGYICNKLVNKIAAVNTVNKILETVGVLSEFPQSGKVFYLPDNSETVYRYLVIDDYLAFYTVEGEQVNIVRIIYGKRNYIDTLGLLRQ